jgi:hypothetical protein
MIKMEAALRESTLQAHPNITETAKNMNATVQHAPGASARLLSPTMLAQNLLDDTVQSCYLTYQISY